MHYVFERFSNFKKSRVAIGEVKSGYKDIIYTVNTAKVND